MGENLLWDLGTDEARIAPMLVYRTPWSIAPTVFTSYFPHLSLCQWKSALLIVLLISPTAIITSTNIHLYYDVFLMRHINCLCCCVCSYSLLFMAFLLSFSLNLLYFSNSYCMSFSVLVDGVWLTTDKRITYLLTYLYARATTIPRRALCPIIIGRKLELSSFISTSCEKK